MSIASNRTFLLRPDTDLLATLTPFAIHATFADEGMVIGRRIAKLDLPFLGSVVMQLLAPDILEEARGLSPWMSGTGIGLGFLLWLFGGRTHRFWLAMSVTLTAGVMGLSLGRNYGMQPLVAGLLLAVSAGALALSLVRILLFAVGGLAALTLLQTLTPAWDEPIAVFLVGGLIGVLLYRFWIVVFSSTIGGVLMAYSTLALLDRFHRLDSVAWTEKNGPLLNWACGAWIVLGVLIQLLLDRRRRRKAQAPEGGADFEEEPSPPAKPTPAGLRTWGEKWIDRLAG